MGIADIAKKLMTARASGGGNYFRDGSGILIVKALKHETLYKGETFVAEFVVESSKSDPTAKDAAGQPIEANPPGTTVTFIQQYDVRPDTAFAQVKAFLFALFDESDDSLAKAAAANKRQLQDEFGAAYNAAVGEAQLARGMRIKYSTIRKYTKDKSKLLTLPVFETLKQTAEQIAATRAQLDKGE